MKSLLDRPIWSALTTRQSRFGAGPGSARRFRPEFLPFAATETDDASSVAALADLADPDETLLLLTANPNRCFPGFEITMAAEAVQLIAENVPAPAPDPEIEPLGAGDVREMLELARLTKPGPFSERSRSLGRFWGVRKDGRIAAMAGERLKQPGFTELSGVCTHPDFRGQGHARRLSVHVAARIFEAGDRPYLHAYAANDAAVRLYRSIGFVLRSEMHVVGLRRAGA